MDECQNIVREIRSKKVCPIRFLLHKIIENTNKSKDKVNQWLPGPEGGGEGNTWWL